MPLVRTEMSLPARDRQTHVPQRICNIFHRSAPHPKPVCKSLSQIVPAKVLDLRFRHGLVKASRPFLNGSSVVADWNRRPLASPRSCTTLRGGHRNIIMKGRESVLRPRKVKHPTFPVYHVRRQSVLAALAALVRTGVARQVEIWDLRDLWYAIIPARRA